MACPPRPIPAGRVPTDPRVVLDYLLHCRFAHAGPPSWVPTALWADGARTLCDLYGELNDRFWGGLLPPAVLKCSTGRQPGTARQVLVRRVGMPWGVYPSAPCTIGTFFHPIGASPAEIRVLAPLGAARERQILLHEMTHAALHFHKRDPELIAHGYAFVAELRRLARRGEAAWADDQAVRYEHEQRLALRRPRAPRPHRAQKPSCTVPAAPPTRPEMV
jgi:hypothetical protein